MSELGSHLAISGLVVQHVIHYRRSSLGRGLRNVVIFFCNEICLIKSMNLFMLNECKVDVKALPRKRLNQFLQFPNGNR